MHVDEILPKVHGRQAHTVALAASAADVLRAAAEVTWKEMPRASSVMRKKKMPDASVLGELSREMGFREVLRTSDEQVFATVLKLPSGSPVAWGGSAPDLAAFTDFAEKGHVKLILNFHHDGRQLTTKTLVQGIGAGSAALFRMAWPVIRLPSGSTRKEWLRAIRGRVAGPTAPD
jgi:hypothetical protein